MFSEALLPPPDPETAADHRRAADVAVLGDTAKMAHALAGAFQRKALKLIETADTPQDHAAAVAYGRAFDHSARTLRQTLALKGRIADHKDLVRRQIAKILCEAGGVHADLTLWQDHVWPREEIQLRPKGSPFAGAWRMADEPPNAPTVSRSLDPMAQPP